MLKLIIGNKAYSSWSLRGWLAAKQSSLPFVEELVNIYGEDWPARRAEGDLALAGGKVPALWDGDHLVWDSLAIIEHLDEKSGGTRFWPAAPSARMLARSMAAEMHSSYLPLRRAHPMNIRRTYPARTPDAEVAANVARIVQLWETALRAHGGVDKEGEGFLFGAFGAVDIMFAPVVRRFLTYALPVPDFARDYMGAVTGHAFMREWTEAAFAESWIAPQFEFEIEAD